MHILIDQTFLFLLYITVRSGDIAISAGIARDTVRAIVYGVVAVLALIATVLLLAGH